MRVQIAAPLDQGTWNGQRRRVVPIVGGTFEGRRFSGPCCPLAVELSAVQPSKLDYDYYEE